MADSFTRTDSKGQQKEESASPLFFPSFSPVVDEHDDPDAVGHPRQSEPERSSDIYGHSLPPITDDEAFLAPLSLSFGEKDSFWGDLFLGDDGQVQ